MAAHVFTGNVALVAGAGTGQVRPRAPRSGDLGVPALGPRRCGSDLLAIERTVDGVGRIDALANPAGGTAL